MRSSPYTWISKPDARAIVAALRKDPRDNLELTEKAKRLHKEEVNMARHSAMKDIDNEYINNPKKAHMSPDPEGAAVAKRAQAAVEAGAREAIAHIKVPLEKRVPLMGSKTKSSGKGHTARPPKGHSSTWGHKSTPFGRGPQ